MSETIRVAAVQMDVSFADKAANLKRMQRELTSAAERGADVVVFPECALTGYCFDSLEEALPLAEPLGGPSCQALVETCQQAGVLAVFGMLERVEQRLFNASVLVGPQGVVGGYRKVHLPYLGIDRFTTPGDRGFPVFRASDDGKLEGVRIGMNICYDGAFPEASRVMALRGADLIVLPTNWPPGAECTADFVINARALENHVFYMAVNRVGTERGFRFIGRSRICDTAGQTLAEAAHENEEVLFADIRPAEARRKHIVRVPNKHEIDRFADRRPETYGDLVQDLSNSTGGTTAATR